MRTNFILFGLFGIHLLSHVDIYSLYRDTIIFKIAFLDCVRLYNEDFVKSRFCPGGGGGTSLLEASGDVSLDEVAFSQLV